MDRRRFVARCIVAAALAVGAAGCGASDGARAVPWTESGRSLAAAGATYRFTIDRDTLAFRLTRPATDEVLLESAARSADELATASDGTALALAAGGVTSPSGTTFAPGCRLSPYPGPCLALEGALADGTALTVELQAHADDVVFSLAAASPERLAELGQTLVVAPGDHWYGGGLVVNGAARSWPLENASFELAPFVTDNGTDVATPFWFTHRGAGVLVPGYDPLHLRFDRPDDGGRFAIRAQRVPARIEEPFRGRITYVLSAGADARAAHRQFLRRVPRGPRGGPAWDRPALAGATPPRFDMFERPVWTTWAAYKILISQPRVQGFVDEILDHDFAAGIIEIDDMWTTPAYGDLDFGAGRFPDPAGLVRGFHERGLLASLWVPPFVNAYAKSFREGDASGFFVNRRRADGGLTTSPTSWWDSLGLPIAGLVDVSDAGARDWFGAKLDALVEDVGVDGFKFDAGESNWYPHDGVSDDGSSMTFADDYAAWAADHGAYEVRAAWFSQWLAPVVRQIDKESSWRGNGLAEVVTSSLAFGVIGYPFVLGDMIGGNAYGDFPSSELFIRWVQANAYLPMMQFSILPWDERFTPEVEEVSRRYVELHQALVPTIRRLADEAMRSGDPIVRPLYWEFPDQDESYTIGDEFLLGPDILVAPVLDDGVRARDVWLPPGAWRDRVTGARFDGPATLTGYPAPLADIPAFDRVG